MVIEKRRQICANDFVPLVSVICERRVACDGPRSQQTTQRGLDLLRLLAIRLWESSYVCDCPLIGFDPG